MPERRGVRDFIRAVLRIEPDATRPQGGGAYPDFPLDGHAVTPISQHRNWMSVPAAYAAINLLASTMARLPFRVGRLDEAGRFDAIPNHPLAALLMYPSTLFDRWQFWEGVYRSLFGSGNSYCWIRKDRMGNPVELIPAQCTAAWWVEPARGYRVRVRRRLQLWGRGYESRQVDCYDKDVLSFHGPDFSGLESPSPIRMAAREVLTTMGMAAGHNRRSLEQGTQINGVVVTGPELLGNPKLIETARKQLAENFAGVRNAGKTPVLPPGFSWVNTQGISAVDLQLIEVMKFGVEDIARVFGVPPRLLQHFHEGGRVSQKVEAQAEDFERYSIKPHAHRIQTQITRKLLTGPVAALAGNGVVVEIDTDPLRQGTLSERVATADQLCTKGGLATIDEGRAIVGLPPLPNGEGDRLLAPKGAPAANASGMEGEGIDKDADEA